MTEPIEDQHRARTSDPVRPPPEPLHHRGHDHHSSAQGDPEHESLRPDQPRPIGYRPGNQCAPHPQFVPGQDGIQRLRQLALMPKAETADNRHAPSSPGERTQ